MPSIQGISAGASALQAAQVQQQVGVAVARKTLDAAEAQGEAAVSLLQAAADFQQQMVTTASPLPHLGKAIDVFA